MTYGTHLIRTMMVSRTNLDEECAMTEDEPDRSERERPERYEPNPFRSDLPGNPTTPYRPPRRPEPEPRPKDPPPKPRDDE